MPGTYRSPAETGFYYLNARYYDPALGRFINPDSFVTTGQGLTSYNMYAYCNNNPINMVDPDGYLAASIATAIGCSMNPFGLLLIGTVAVIGVLHVSSSSNNTSSPAIGTIHKNDIEFFWFRDRQKDKAKANDKVKDSVSDNQTGNIYYHATTAENAEAIIASGIMKGSNSEGGLIFAFRTMPSNRAVKNSGAHRGVIISFETNTAFVDDWGIDDPDIKRYGPVVSCRPGPIKVKNVRVVGQY